MFDEIRRLQQKVEKIRNERNRSIEMLTAARTLSDFEQESKLLETLQKEVDYNTARLRTNEEILEIKSLKYHL